MLALLLAAAANQTALAATTIEFGVVPEQEANELIKKWQPILDAVSKRAGVKIVLDTSARNISDFYQKYHKGGYDLALVNPQVYAIKTKRGLYEPIARQDANLQGILVVAHSSPYHSLKDLAGKRIAFPSEESYAATVLNLVEFDAAGLRPGAGLEVSYLGNHEKVYEAVASGKADAGGGIMRTFTQLKGDLVDHLRILHTTLPTITHPFVGNVKLPISVRLDVQRALLDLSATPEGVAMLRNVGMGVLIKASDADYDSLRKPGS